MDKAFTVEQRKDAAGDLRWVFCWNRTVVGVGGPNRRCWDTKEELVAELKRLGIEPDRYNIREPQG